MRIQQVHLCPEVRLLSNTQMNTRHQLILNCYETSYQMYISIVFYLFIESFIFGYFSINIEMKEERFTN